MNSYLIKHILLLFVWIPFSWLSAASVQDAESRKAALMLFYAQVKQEPAAALPKLDSLEKTGTFSKGYIDFFRSCAYQALSKYYMSMYYAKRVIHDEAIRHDTLLTKSAYTLLAESSVASYHLTDALRYIGEGKEYANQISDPVLEANMHLMEGEICRRLGTVEKSYDCLRTAIALLKDSMGADELYCRSRIMGFFMKFCIQDRKVEDAWRVGLKREEVIGKLKQLPAFDSGIDEQKAYLYSKMAYLAYRLDKRELAAKYQAKFQQTAMASTVLGKLEINAYLLEKGDCQTVISHINNYLATTDEKDFLNVIYIRSIYQSSRAYQQLAMYKEAYEAMLKLRDVMEAMRLSAERSEFFDLADLTQAMEQEYELKQAETALRVRNWVITGLVLVALVLIALLVRIYLYWKAVREKNRKMTLLILELNEEKNRIYACTEVNTLETSDEVAEEEGKAEEPESDSPAGAEAVAPDFHPIFVAFDKRVREERIYLNYQLSRNDYAAVMGVDRNRFAAILKEYAHGNLSAYLNGLRLEYSVELFRTHPDWPINEIAVQCALPSLSTFYRLFKEKYGMSPSVFRKSLVSNKGN